MNRTPIQSSNLRSIGYDPSRNQMEVEFNTGRIYRYDGVPKILHDGLLISHSAGTFFNDRIRSRFRGVELTEENNNG